MPQPHDIVQAEIDDATIIPQHLETASQMKILLNAPAKFHSSSLTMVSEALARRDSESQVLLVPEEAADGGDRASLDEELGHSLLQESAERGASRASSQPPDHSSTSSASPFHRFASTVHGTSIIP